MFDKYLDPSLLQRIHRAQLKVGPKWRTVHLITPEQRIQKLTLQNLDWHLNHYDEPDPLMGNAPFYENTPFISATAGVVERDVFAARNIVFDPLMTAIQFATRDFTTVGHVFFGYVFTPIADNSVAKHSVRISGLQAIYALEYFLEEHIDILISVQRC